MNNILFNKIYFFLCKIFYRGKYRDITGIKLNPDNPYKCKGNGDYKGIEICCENCDYGLQCYIEFMKEEEYETCKE